MPSIQAMEQVTKLVERTCDHYANTIIADELTLLSERRLVAEIIKDLALVTKNLQLEVERLGRQFEDVCGKSTR